MKEQRDPWYVRLPDGRVLKAKSTAAVQHHIEAGHIPLNSYARREPSDEWVALGWIQEFADRGVAGRTPASVHDTAARAPAAPAAPEPNTRSGVSARLDPLRLQTVGVRGYMEELFAALDSTLHRNKLWTGCLTGAVLALVQYFVPQLTLQLWEGGARVGVAITGFLGAIVLAFGVSAITRQTHLELSTMRPVSWAEARAGVQPFFLRLFFCYLILGGLALGILLVFHFAPDWVLAARVPEAAIEPVLTVVTIVGLFVTVWVFLALFQAWLLAPILVVEEGSVGDAFREWRALIREHRLRIFLYEGLAIALGIITMLPLAIPLYAARSFGPMVFPNVVGHATVATLWGVISGPFIAFLAVANVFVYLNLRYEYTPAK